MIPWLEGATPFPPVERALDHPNGLLAASATLEPERLLQAYQRGIFPWYCEGEPVLWWSPDPRLVLRPSAMRVSHSLRKTLRRVALDPDWEIGVDGDFEQTMRECAAPRPGQDGTWISEDIVRAYCALARQDLAHSIEVRWRGQAVGGLYGVALGRAFFGESMFSRRTDASKIALATLVRILLREGVAMIDCQQSTRHLASLGAEELARAQFCELLRGAVHEAPVPWARYRGRRLNELLLAPSP